jgi:hypothetical protein
MAIPTQAAKCEKRISIKRRVQLLIFFGSHGPKERAKVGRARQVCYRAHAVHRKTSLRDTVRDLLDGMNKAGFETYLGLEDAGYLLRMLQFKFRIAPS